jgi:sulfite exporter TauE/SafE
MCGPLVMLFARNQRQAGADPLPPLVLYQIGRVSSYALLGALAGALGAGVRGITLLRGWQGGLSIVLGLFVLMAGMSLAGWLRVEALPPFLLRPSAWVSRTLRHFMRSRHPAAPLGLGLANGFLPCGAVYAMLLLAATTGDPGRGALTLVVFGLGTLPAMMGMGLFASLLEARTRLAFQRLAALLVMAVGLQLTFRGLASNSLISSLDVAGLRLW